MSRQSNHVTYSVKQVGWESCPDLIRIRTEVFIIEQGVPEAMEWDGLDENALHLLASDKDGQPAGCARILENSSIGRMAVLKAHRGQGIGRALLEHAIAICHERGWRNITLSAQMHAIGFYSDAGFTVCSKEYLDAGIPHCDMRKTL